MQNASPFFSNTSQFLRTYNNNNSISCFSFLTASPAGETCDTHLGVVSSLDWRGRAARSQRQQQHHKLLKQKKPQLDTQNGVNNDYSRLSWCCEQASRYAPSGFCGRKKAETAAATAALAIAAQTLNLPPLQLLKLLLMLLSN